jgi:hypothetical protein
VLHIFREHVNTKAIARPTKIFILLLFLICTPRVAISTTVMAVFTPTLVTIGVDGLGTYSYEGKDVPLKACKALVAENTVYVASGQIPEGIRGSVLAMGDWFSVSDETLNSSALRTSIEAMRNRAVVSDPARSSKYAPGSRVLTIAVARPSGGRIRFRVTFFLATQIGTVIATHQDLTEAGVTFDSGAPSYLPPMPKDFLKADPLELVRNGVQGAFTRPDSFSGPPITLLQITPYKINWVDHGNCRDDGNNAWDTTPPPRR